MDTQAVTTTTDRRYVVVAGRLWRAANPGLPPEVSSRLVRELMAARREVRRAKDANDLEAVRAARRAVQAAKVALGERGPVWWTDGAPDENRRMVASSSYASWYENVAKASVRRAATAR